jgi:hypothetical protein
MFIILLIVSISGLILGWKKQSQGAILPLTLHGSNVNPESWLTYGELHSIAISELARFRPEIKSFELERIDARPDHGIVKFLFKDHFWEIQLDATTGENLQIAYRYSDLLESIHDGSILDTFFQTEQDILKVIYTSLVGLSLFTFCITGFWLYYGPKFMRKK